MILDIDAWRRHWSTRVCPLASRKPSRCRSSSSRTFSTCTRTSRHARRWKSSLTRCKSTDDCVKSSFAIPFCHLVSCSVGTSKRRIMSTTQLVDFLNKTQRDPRLNEILHPYANPARAKDLIQQYEPNKFNAQKGQLSFDGFLR
jgi:Phosphoinositide-specific phospholipase C, efhand-like